MAGRPKGSRNKKTVAEIKAASESLLKSRKKWDDPVDMMMEIATYWKQRGDRNKQAYEELVESADENSAASLVAMDEEIKRCDDMAMSALGKAAPYLRAQLKSIEHSGSGDEKPPVRVQIQWVTPK